MHTPPLLHVECWWPVWFGPVSWHIFWVVTGSSAWHVLRPLFAAAGVDLHPGRGVVENYPFQRHLDWASWRLPEPNAADVFHDVSCIFAGCLLDENNDKALMYTCGCMSVCQSLLVRLSALFQSRSTAAKDLCEFN